MVSKFPITMVKNEKIKATENAMPSALEGTILDEPVAFSELVLAAAVLFIFCIFSRTTEPPVEWTLPITSFCQFLGERNRSLVMSTAQYARWSTNSQTHLLFIKWPVSKCHPFGSGGGSFFFFFCNLFLQLNYLQYNAYHKLSYNHVSFFFFFHTTLTGNYNTYTDAI